MTQPGQPHIVDQTGCPDLGSFRPLVSVFIKGDNSQGQGNSSQNRAIINEEIAGLCQKIQEEKSIYAGAAKMGMSYGKAWRIIKETETALGFPLFTREGCKGSALTKEAANLLDTYAQIQQALNEKAEQLCKELLG